VFIQHDMRSDYDRGLILRARLPAPWNAREQVALRLDGARDKADCGNEVGAMGNVKVGGDRGRGVSAQQPLDERLPDPCRGPLHAPHVLVRRAGLPAREQKRLARALRLGEEDRVRDGLAPRQRSTVERVEGVARASVGTSCLELCGLRAQTDDPGQRGAPWLP